MAYQVPKEWHQCSTCERWAGQRKLDSFRMFVETESAMDTGECVGGPFDRMQTYANHECDQWSKWGLIP